MRPAHYLERVDRIMAGRSFDPALRGSRSLEMSTPTYRELATNFTLWSKLILLEERVSEREFNEMSSTKSSISFRDASGTRSAHSRRRHASVKEWVDKTQAFWNWKFHMDGRIKKAIRAAHAKEERDFPRKPESP
jgi:hypothetical protein